MLYTQRVFVQDLQKLQSFYTYIISSHEIRVFEGSGILSYLQANKLACYYFVDAGKI